MKKKRRKPVRRQNGKRLNKELTGEDRRIALLIEHFKRMVETIGEGVAKTNERLDQDRKEYTNRFNQIDKQFVIVNGRLNCIEDRLDKVEYRLDGMDDRLDSIEDRLSGHDAKFIEMENRFDRIDETFKSTHQELRIIQNNFTSIHIKLDKKIDRAEFETRLALIK